MKKYRDIDECVEVYLKRQLKHYKQLKALRIILQILYAILPVALLFGVSFVRVLMEDKESLGVWGTIEVIGYILIIILAWLLILYIFYENKNWVLSTLEGEYKEGRYVWWDSGHKNHKRETYGGYNKERFFNAIVEASINVCGSETCCYSYSEDYVKDSMLFLEILWHKYNCDKEVRKEWFHIVVGDARKITLSDARYINDHIDEIRWDFKAKEK